MLLAHRDCGVNETWAKTMLLSGLKAEKRKILSPQLLYFYNCLLWGHSNESAQCLEESNYE